MKTLKMNELKGATNALEEAVQAWINERASDYDNGVEGVLIDLFKGGCVSGYVTILITYTDTMAFFQLHKSDINKILVDFMDNTGSKSPVDLFGDKWDSSDPLAQNPNNQNLLAWFGFEETARVLAQRNGIDY